jgi:hypothetical protein
MTIAHFEDSPPLSDTVTSYDERHFVTYLRLLDAAEEGANWTEAVEIIFGIDPALEPTRARLVHESHLDRARWMTSHGYRYLLEKKQKG